MAPTGVAVCGGWRAEDKLADASRTTRESAPGPHGYVEKLSSWSLRGHHNDPRNCLVSHWLPGYVMPVSVLSPLSGQSMSRRQGGH